MGSGRDHISDDGSLSRWELRLTLLSYALKINMRVAGLESPTQKYELLASVEKGQTTMSGTLFTCRRR